jgi:acyl dehydratase
MTTFFNDIAIGDTEKLGSHTFAADEIKAFARAFDPQAFHVDEAAGAASHFGGLCASGWHTASVFMRLRVDTYRRQADAAAAQGLPFPKLGPSPGFRTMRWLRPVKPGDTLTYWTKVVDKRASATRKGWGVVTVENWAESQTGDRVFEFTAAAFWELHPGAVE